MKVAVRTVTDAIETPGAAAEERQNKERMPHCTGRDIGHQMHSSLRVQGWASLLPVQLRAMPLFVPALCAVLLDTYLGKL